MIPPPHRRMLLLAFGLLLAACTRTSANSPISPTPTAVTSTAVTTAEARNSPAPVASAVATRSSTRSATPTGAATATRMAATAPGTPATLRGTATRSPVTTPTGPGRPLTPPPTVGAAAWERLRRPLQLPALAAGTSCPQTEGRVVEPAYSPALGDGPVYAVGLGTAGVLRLGRQEGDWYGQKVNFLVAPAYRGPVLIRGRQLDGPNEARFDEGAAPSAELQLLPVAGAADWRGYPSTVWFRAPGCYAWQLDGEDFSEVIVFQVVQ